MLLEFKDSTLSNVWLESFVDSKGKEVQYYRAMVNVPGEVPMQCAVDKEDAEGFYPLIGSKGTAVLDMDLTPGRRPRVTFKGFK